MKIEDLLVFIEIVECGSISSASDKLYIGKQSAGKSIKRLENFFGVQLLLKTAKGVVLTEQGQEIYQFAVSQREKYQELKEKINLQLGAQLRGTINLGVANRITRDILPEIICEFYKKYPNVKVEVKELSNRDIFHETENGNIDLGLIVYLDKNENFLAVPDCLKYGKVFKGQIYYWVNNKSKLANKEILEYEDLAKQTIVLNSGMDLELFDMMLEEKNVTVNNVVRTDNMHLLTKFVENNLAILPDMKYGKISLGYAKFFHEQNVQAIPLRNDHNMAVSIGYCIRKDKKDDIIIAKMVEFLNAMR